MSCSPFDLRDYCLKELADADERQVESHLHECPACREEVERLRLTEATLAALRDEEIPQRIAFVSDPVFERRWWSEWSRSGARLGFAGAALLSAALVFATVERRPVTALTSADVDRRIERAVSASEQRQTLKTTQLVHDLAERAASEHLMRVAAEQDAHQAREQNFAMEKRLGDLVTQGSN